MRAIPGVAAAITSSSIPKFSPCTSFAFDGRLVAIDSPRGHLINGRDPAVAGGRPFSLARPAAADLRRQRGTYPGFDQRDIHRVDQPISIHVFAEIRTRHRLAYLRLRQAHIGGIDDGIPVYITDQNA